MHGDSPELARKKFQAISMAYEILSIPELRSDSDCYGVVHVQWSNHQHLEPMRANQAAQTELSSLSGMPAGQIVQGQILIHVQFRISWLPLKNSRGAP